MRHTNVFLISELRTCWLHQGWRVTSTIFWIITSILFSANTVLDQGLSESVFRAVLISGSRARASQKLREPRSRMSQMTGKMEKRSASRGSRLRHWFGHRKDLRAASHIASNFFIMNGSWPMRHRQIMRKNYLNKRHSLTKWIALASLEQIRIDEIASHEPVRAMAREFGSRAASPR